MSSLTLAYALAFYFAVAVLAIGLAYKARQFWGTPAALKIPLMPATLTKKGVSFRLAREAVHGAALQRFSGRLADDGRRCDELEVQAPGP